MSSISEEANKLADFILFTQRSCILNLSSELNEGKVSYPQFFLLTYLASEDFLSMSSIALKMGHSTAAATGMVDKLQEMGYLKRMSAAKDRRKIMVAITQEGRDLVDRMRQNIVRDLAALMAGADPDARQTLADTGKSIRKRRLALISGLLPSVPFRVKKSGSRISGNARPFFYYLFRSVVNREQLPSLAAGAGRVLHGLKTEIPHEPAIPGIPVRSHPDFRPSGLVRSAPPCG